MKNIKEKLNNIRIEQILEICITLLIIGMAIFNITNIITDHQSGIYYLIDIMCIMVIITLIIDVELYKISNETEK